MSLFRFAFSIAVINIIIIFAGCSGGISPVTAKLSPDMDSSFKSLPAGVTDWDEINSPLGGMGTLGLFHVRLDSYDLTSEVMNLRKGALNDVLESVDITNFLTMAPCVDCVKINSVALDMDGNIVASIGIKHPFPVGEPLKPITGRNRADLHVFNIEGIVVLESAGANFPGLGETVSDDYLVNADGYTGYQDTSLDEIFPTDATAHPYILHFDDYSAGNFDPLNPMGFESVTIPPPSGNLVMAMGCDYNYKDYVFHTEGSVDFIFAVGCTYGVASTSMSLRFTPEYRIPQHNKKAASEIRVEIIDNQLMGGVTTSTADIEVRVVDISHGVPVGTALNEMFADSSVDQIFVEVPGVMTSALVIDGSTPVSGSGHDPSDPLVYGGTITNTAGGPEGDYSGLVKVVDSYSPGLNGSPLLSGMDGIKRVPPIVNPLTGLFTIDEFATYQFFSISISTSQASPEVYSINPSSGIQNCLYDNVLITGLNFDSDAQVTLVKSPSGTPVDATNEVVDPMGTSLTCTIDLDASNFDLGFYDVTVTNPTPGLSGTLPQGFEVTVDLSVVFQNEVKLFNHPIWDEFSPCIGQDPNGQLVAFWYAHQPYPSIDVPGRSVNGLTWTGGSNVFGSTCTNCRADVMKVAPRTTSGLFVLIMSTFATTNVYCATDYGAFSAPYIGNYPKRTYNLEMMIDPIGHGYGCGDLNGQIVFKKTPLPNIPDNSPTYPIAPGRLSHVRSWGCDSAGLLYLAFLDTIATKIQLSHGTDTTNLLWTTPIIVFQDAAYDDVRDPSVHLVNDVIHMTFLRHNISSGNYELCYTKANVSDLVFSTPVIIDSSSVAFEDAHIQVGNFFSVPVIAVAYEKGTTLYLNYSTCDAKTWHTPIQVQTSAMNTEDCDMIFLNHTASLTEDLIIIWAERNAGGNRDIITRMAHFVQ